MKKLTINKETIATLTRDEMSNVNAGFVWKACWENLWTAYYCKVVCTGESFNPQNPPK
jgi:hypothetical protein